MKQEQEYKDWLGNQLELAKGRKGQRDLELKAAKEDNNKLKEEEMRKRHLKEEEHSEFIYNEQKLKQKLLLKGLHHFLSNRVYSNITSCCVKLVQQDSYQKDHIDALMQLLRRTFPNASDAYWLK